MSYSRKQSAEAWAAQLNFAAIEKKHGLPAGILTNLVRQESQGNCDAVSPVGARGLCQFMPATAKQRGVNASDPLSSVNGAADYLEDLIDMFGGDVDKGIAAYNYGQGNMRKLIGRHGDRWREHLPAETKDYLRIVSKGIGSSYVQRAASGELSEDDRTNEENRRRNRLRQFGFGDAAELMPQNDVLGQLFFALVSSVIAAIFDKREQGQTTAQPELSAPPPPPLASLQSAQHARSIG